MSVEKREVNFHWIERQKTGYEEVYYFSELIFALTHAVESSNEWLLAFSSPSFRSNFQTWIFFDDVEWRRFVRLNMTNFASNHVRRNWTCAEVMDFSRKMKISLFLMKQQIMLVRTFFNFQRKRRGEKCSSRQGRGLIFLCSSLNVSQLVNFLLIFSQTEQFSLSFSCFSVFSEIFSAPPASTSSRVSDSDEFCASHEGKIEILNSEGFLFCYFFQAFFRLVIEIEKLKKTWQSMLQIARQTVPSTSRLSVNLSTLESGTSGFFMIFFASIEAEPKKKSWVFSLLRYRPSHRQVFELRRLSQAYALEMF